MIDSKRELVEKIKGVSTLVERLDALNDLVDEVIGGFVEPDFIDLRGIATQLTRADLWNLESLIMSLVNRGWAVIHDDLYDIPRTDEATGWGE